jgi:hypothetical protein
MHLRDNFYPDADLPWTRQLKPPLSKRHHTSFVQVEKLTFLSSRLKLQCGGTSRNLTSSAKTSVSLVSLHDSLKYIAHTTARYARQSLVREVRWDLLDHNCACWPWPEINAAATIQSITLYSGFDLTETYFLTAGIAGVNPNVATLGSVTYARYAVQVAQQYEFDIRDLGENFTTGYIPYGTTTPAPAKYPQDVYGTEVFEVNAALRDRVSKHPQYQTSF